MTPSIGFSQKPRPEGYVDIYETVTTYAAILIGPAQAIDPDVTPLRGKPFTTDEGDGVFVYLDTFSSRAGISARSKRLELAKVAIVGLGDTSGYILDLLAKTSICNIHLYDGDVFSTHNAFRAPGAAPVNALNARMKKVDYYATACSAMRRQVHPHPVNVTAANVAELLDADFLLLAVDSGPDKQVLMSALVAAGIAFIDTGVGVSDDANGIAGQVRVTTALPDASEHLIRGGLISVVAGDAAEYDTNLQVAELNMAAAFMAVVRFKKWLGFYADSEGELHSSYRIDTNEILNKYERAGGRRTVERWCGMRLHGLEPTFVAYVPRDLEDGRIYVSMEYATAVHLCACGCGTKTITPLSIDGWTLTFNGTVTWRPSAGNGQAPCRSHYMVSGDKLRWLPPMGAAETRAAIAHDHEVAASVHAVPARAGWWSRVSGPSLATLNLAVTDGAAPRTLSASRQWAGAGRVPEPAPVTITTRRSSCVMGGSVHVGGSRTGSGLITQCSGPPR